MEPGFADVSKWFWFPAQTHTKPSLMNTKKNAKKDFKRFKRFYDTWCVNKFFIKPPSKYNFKHSSKFIFCVLTFCHFSGIFFNKLKVKAFIKFEFHNRTLIILLLLWYCNINNHHCDEFHIAAHWMLQLLIPAILFLLYPTNLLLS